MKSQLKLYRSSTVGITSDNFKLLCDPWLRDGEYYGAWSHYPPYDLDKNLDEINSYDAIYISHIHPDHCSEKTLSMISKDIPIYILAYHSKLIKLLKIMMVSNWMDSNSVHIQKIHHLIYMNNARLYKILEQFIVIYGQQYKQI